MKKLLLSAVAASGLLFSSGAWAVWTSFSVPGMMSVDFSTGTVAGSYISTQMATGVAQTAMGGVTVKAGPVTVDMKASNTLNNLSTKGSVVGSYISTQMGTGVAQTAMGNASNTANGGGME